VWGSEVGGRRLTFHLAGINNQNFIMRDEETGSWWQQVTGEAIHGPLKGQRLEPIFSDEVSFAVWKRERPQGRVLRPDERVAGRYEAADWEEKYAELPVVTPVSPGDQFPPRELMAGVVIGGKAKAYPLADLERERLILDSVGGTPIFVAAGEDGKSVRAFERRVEGRVLEFFAQARPEAQFVDAETGTTWDFSGRAVGGPLLGKQLTKVAVLKDYWFDWKIYHPETAVYTLGARRPRTK